MEKGREGRKEEDRKRRRRRERKACGAKAILKGGALGDEEEEEGSMVCGVRLLFVALRLFAAFYLWFLVLRARGSLTYHAFVCRIRYCCARALLRAAAGAFFFVYGIGSLHTAVKTSTTFIMRFTTWRRARARARLCAPPLYSVSILILLYNIISHPPHIVQFHACRHNA